MPPNNAANASYLAPADIMRTKLNCSNKPSQLFPPKFYNCMQGIFRCANLYLVGYTKSLGVRTKGFAYVSSANCAEDFTAKPEQCDR